MIKAIVNAFQQTLAMPNVRDAVATVVDQASFLGVPVLDLANKLARARSEMRHAMFVEKVRRFLVEYTKLDVQQRVDFLAELEQLGRSAEFGEAVLLLLERADHMSKPEIIARIVSAMALFRIKYDFGMRLCSMVDRVYFEDLKPLQTFKNGVQKNKPIAESLLAAGFVSLGGFDGGTLSNDDDGGMIYYLNDYGEALIRHGMKVSTGESAAE